MAEPGEAASAASRRSRVGALSRSSGTPSRSTRQGARALALILGVGLLPVLVAELVFLSPTTVQLVAGMTLVVTGLAVVALAFLAAGRSWRVLFLPLVVLLDMAAVLFGALLPIGIDVAVILPFLGAVVVIAEFDGWPLRAGLAAAWISGIAGVGLGRLSPGLAAVPNASSVPFAVIMIAIGTGVGYSILGWAANHWRMDIDEKVAAVAAAQVAEAAQQRAAERLRALVDNSPLPIIAFDGTGAIHSWNPTAERLLGWTAAEALGMHVQDLVPEELRPGVLARLERTMAGHLAGPRATRFLCKDGTETRAEIYDGLERDVDGRPVAVVVQFLDVSEREAMALRLVEAQRLEAVGQLAGGVAHDFNNSLTAIAGFASLIASGDSPDPLDDARTILGAAEHAAILTRQLLAFSRRVPLQPRLIDLRDFLKGVAPLVRSLVGETVHVRIETYGRPALVEVDPPSLEQAILNMTANARDAMPMGGELTLCVRAYPGCPFEGVIEPKPHLAVCVADTGSGIPAGVIERVFEPFFTTKPVGKGTGLGLAMVHGFAAQSGGHVVVNSPPGQGATFEIHFPEAAGVPQETLPPPEPAGGSESILFVEDDPGVASFGLACLRRLGYDVTPAMSGSEAVALAASRSAPFDLLLTDVVIPGMSGLEIASLIHRHHPTTAILYVSGYSPEHVGDGILGPDVAFLPKPYSLSQLASKVREVLDQTHAAAIDPDGDAGG